MNKIIISTLLLLTCCTSVKAEELWSRHDANQIKQTINKGEQPENLMNKSKLHSIYQQGNNFRLNRTLLSQSKVGTSFNISISANDNYRVTINRIKLHVNGGKTFFGSINSGNERLPVVLTLGSKQFFFRIVTPTGAYTANGNGFNGLFLKESKLNSVIDHSQKDYLIPKKPTLPSPPLSEYQYTESSSPIDENEIFQPSVLSTQTLQSSIIEETSIINAAEQTNEQAQIDVLFVYSQTVADLYAGDATTRINHIVEVTNQIYFDSEVHITMNAVGMSMVDYPDSYTSSDALNDITDGSHIAFDNVNKLRYELGADMVVLLRPHDGGDKCGLAWRNGVNGLLSYATDKMFSHVSVDCGATIAAHETGHNLGLSHSRKQDGHGDLFPFSLGHGVEDDFVTVMAYSSEFNGSKIYKYSNPNLTCNGLPCGVDRNDVNNGADAAYSLNAKRFHAQGFNRKSTNLILAGDAIENVSDANLKLCIEKEIAQKGHHYAGQLKLLSCENSNVNSLNGIEAFTGLKRLFLENNQIVDISPLVHLTLLYQLQLENNQIVDISAVSNLNLLFFLDLSNNQIVDIGAVSNLNLLSTLYLSNNQIVDITALSNLNSFNRLYLSNNQIVSISALSNLNISSYLLLDGNKIVDVSPLSNINLLSYLHLQDNQIVDITALSSLNSLRKLQLQDNQILDISPLSNLTKLEVLFLDNNPFSDISPLSQTTELTHLSLSNTNISDLSSIFYLMDKGYDFHITLDPIDSIYCWQLDYLQMYKSSRFQRPLNCSSTQDNLDFDGDGLSNLNEFIYGANPTIADTDNDGLNDGDEVNIHHTNPSLSDTDSDGLDDGDEINIHHTNPSLADTDSDGLSDGFEVLYGLDPFSTDESALDPDNDGLTNLAEFTLRTNPIIADTDNDGLDDGDEVNVHHTNPTLADTDRDSLKDGWELSNNRNPIQADYFISAGGGGTCTLDDNELTCRGLNSFGQMDVPALTNPISVSMTAFRTCALDDNGVSCWGMNGNGQTDVPALLNPVFVANGPSEVCAIDDNGVSCWGADYYGKPALPTLVNPVSISVSQGHTCALDDNGVSCWGSNSNGNNDVPALVNPVSVDTGDYHTCALDDNGVSCWGYNTYGQTNVPVNLVNPIYVTAAGYYSCAIDDNGVSCWGKDSEVLMDVPVLTNPVSVSLGSGHACALDDNGVTCWGSNRYRQAEIPDTIDTDKDGLTNKQEGKFGTDRLDSDTDNDGLNDHFEVLYRLDPINTDESALDLDNDGLAALQEQHLGTSPISADSDRDSLRDDFELNNNRNPIQPDYLVSAGNLHSCALADDEVSCWGDNQYGQTDVPILVNPVSLSVGQYHACALDSNGVSCWGLNNEGQTDVANLVNPISVSAGGRQTCALDDNGVSCWGYNYYGQQDVPILANPVSVSAGMYHACAIDNKGLNCWGANKYSELTVPDLTYPISVDTFNRHTCAIDNNIVSCWGLNDDGQTDVPDLVNPVLVSAGYFHTCAIDDNGVSCWGDNSNSQLDVPTTLVNPVSLTAGAVHTCALGDNGITCWGSNTNGQMDVPDIIDSGTVENDFDGDGISDELDSDDDNDGVPDTADAFPLDATESVDTDGDLIGNNADNDDDGDGIIDEDDSAPLDPTIGDTLAAVFSSIDDITVEATGVTTVVELVLPEVIDNNLNAPTLVSDNDVALALGSHEITWTATDFAGNISSAIQLVHIVDTTAPEFSELPVQTMDARGLLTNIANDIDIFATDLVDGDVSAVIVGDTFYDSGEHTLELTVQDKTGNTATAEVIVHINPIVELGQDNQVEASSPYKALIALSGKAAIYPVTIGYEFSGAVSGDNSGNNLGELIIDNSDSAFIEFSIAETAQAGDVLTVTLTSATNAVLMTDKTMTLTVVDENQAPTATILVEQDNKPVSIIDAKGGLVTVTATVNDLNQFDTHTITWDVGDSAFVDARSDGSDNTFEFEPDLLTSATYDLSVKVIENNTSDSFESVVDISLIVEAELATLSAETDVDNDGISDVDEGYADSDQDGISDYLDDDSNTSRLPLGENSKPIQTVNGLHLRLGDVVSSSQSFTSSNATIDADDIATSAGDNGSAVDNAADNHFEVLSNIINFNVSGLSASGDTVPVVIPLTDNEFIPINAVYRKYIATSGWFTFVTNDNNSISSALKDSDGNCPSPLSDTYKDGLVVGHNCIELLIEDGGENDADGMANGVVKDPGVLATELPNQAPIISLVSTLSVDEETNVNLDASGTSDSDGDSLTYVWSQLSGTTVELTNQSTSSVSFTSQEVTADEVLSFELTVSDGFDTVTATITVTVNNVNQAPTVSIDSHSATFNEGSSVSLTSTSSDPDGDGVTYSWTQTAGPTVTLSDATTVTVSFTAPQVSSNQTIALTLTVSDGDLEATTTTSITVNDVPAPTPKPKPKEESSGGGGSMSWLILIAGFGLVRRRYLAKIAA